MRIFESIILTVLHTFKYIVKGFKVTFSTIGWGLLWLCVFVYWGFLGIFNVITFPFRELGKMFSGVNEKINKYQHDVEEKKRLEEIERKKRKLEEAKAREERQRQAEESRKEALKIIKERNEKAKAAENAAKQGGAPVPPGTSVTSAGESGQQASAGAQPEQRKNDTLFSGNDEEEMETGFGAKINMALEAIIGVPASYFKKMKDKAESKRAENLAKKEDVNRQALMLSFEGEDVEKQEKKVMWEYVCRTPEGKTVKGYFAAYSKLEVHSFLMSEGMTVYSIRTNKWIQTMYSSVNGNGAKIKKKDLIFFLTQLSTYIKSGIPLVEAFGILMRQFKDKNYQRMFRAMMYDLTMGDSFSKAMENQGNSFPPILINMVKSSELTGELPEALDDMAEYFTQTEEAKKEMISAMTYPCIVLMLAVVVSIFMMVYIVPQFAEIFTSMDGADIPVFTKIVLDLSDFLKANLIKIIVVAALVIVVFMYLFKNVKVWRKGTQWVLMHIPVVSNIIIYNEVSMFSKTFSSLLSHNVFITDSMKVLRKITNNEIYKSLIFDTVNNLAAGEKVSTAFKDHWAFPVPAYEMIVTGEKTGQLAEMMSKVSSYYQSEHKNSVTRVKALMEPVIIVFLTVVVGMIVLAIVIPMFSMYDAVGGL